MAKEAIKHAPVDDRIKDGVGAGADMIKDQAEADPNAGVGERLALGVGESDVCDGVGWRGEGVGESVLNIEYFMRVNTECPSNVLYGRLVSFMGGSLQSVLYGRLVSFMGGSLQSVLYGRLLTECPLWEARVLYGSFLQRVLSSVLNTECSKRDFTVLV